MLSLQMAILIIDFAADRRRRRHLGVASNAERSDSSRRLRCTNESFAAGPHNRAPQPRNACHPLRTPAKSPSRAGSARPVRAWNAARKATTPAPIRLAASRCPTPSQTPTASQRGAKTPLTHQLSRETSTAASSARAPTSASPPRVCRMTIPLRIIGHAVVVPVAIRFDRRQPPRFRGLCCSAGCHKSSARRTTRSAAADFDWAFHVGANAW